jgi:hypothetical protein
MSSLQLDFIQVDKKCSFLRDLCNETTDIMRLEQGLNLRV